MNDFDPPPTIEFMTTCVLCRREVWPYAADGPRSHTMARCSHPEYVPAGYGLMKESTGFTDRGLEAIYPDFKLQLRVCEPCAQSLPKHGEARWEAHIRLRNACEYVTALTYLRHLGLKAAEIEWIYGDAACPRPAVLKQHQTQQCDAMTRAIRNTKDAERSS